MKLAILIALASDKRSGAVVAPPRPYDATLEEYKAAVAAGHHPGLTPERPILALWTAQGERKSRKFTVAPHSPEPGESAPQVAPPEEDDPGPASHSSPSEYHPVAPPEEDDPGPASPGSLVPGKGGPRRRSG